MARDRSEAALALLQRAAPYDFGTMAGVDLVYLRGVARLQTGDAAGTAAEFRRVIAHPGIDPESHATALAQLGLARALAATGDAAGSRAAYDALFGLWKDVDADLPVLLEARAERDRLQ